MGRSAEHNRHSADAKTGNSDRTLYTDGETKYRRIADLQGSVVQPPEFRKWLATLVLPAAGRGRRRPGRFAQTAAARPQWAQTHGASVFAALPDSARSAMPNPSWPDRLRRFIISLPADLVLLTLAAPIVLFSTRAPGVATAGVLVMIVASWPVRRWQTERWHLPIPADWPMLALAALLPVAIWAAPPSLRSVYAWPRALILLWNFALFFAVVAYAGQKRRQLAWALTGMLAATQAIALITPFAIERRVKIEFLGAILYAIPGPLVGIFGTEGGFSANQVAGVLLYALPLLIALTLAGLRRGGLRDLRWWATALSAAWMLGVMGLTQSRGALLGLAAGLLATGLLRWRAGWWMIGALALAIPLGLRSLPSSMIELISDTATVRGAGGLQTVTNFRPEVWRAARWGLADFPFTGMGLGTFREVGPLLYSMPSLPDNFNLAHAHNFFLQTGLDVGLLGLAAVVAIHLLAVWSLYRLWQCPQRVGSGWPAFVTWRTLAAAWMGCFVAHLVYSQFDAIALGSKPGFLLWLLFALIFAADRLVHAPPAAV
jgi:O-antigen ligase